MTKYYEPVLPETAVRHWCSISDSERYSEDIAYITLDSGIILDVGCYSENKYKEKSPFTLVVVIGSEDEEEAINGWDNPLEVHRIFDVNDLIDKISELALDYSINGRKYPYQKIDFYIDQYCNSCDVETKHRLWDSIAWCNVCQNREIPKVALRYCPYCVKKTFQIIGNDTFLITCTNCNTSNG